MEGRVIRAGVPWESYLSQDTKQFKADKGPRHTCVLSTRTGYRGCSSGAAVKITLLPDLPPVVLVLCDKHRAILMDRASTLTARESLVQKLRSDNVRLADEASRLVGENERLRSSLIDNREARQRREIERGQEPCHSLCNLHADRRHSCRLVKGHSGAHRTWGGSKGGTSHSWEENFCVEMFPPLRLAGLVEAAS